MPVLVLLAGVEGSVTGPVPRHLAIAGEGPLSGEIVAGAWSGWVGVAQFCGVAGGLLFESLLEQAYVWG